MEHLESMAAARAGTHPLMTVALFGAVICGLVMAGAHVSQQRSAEREFEKAAQIADAANR